MVQYMTIMQIFIWFYNFSIFIWFYGMKYDLQKFRFHMWVTLLSHVLELNSSINDGQSSFSLDSASQVAS
jgi:hypothetical protein